LIQLAVRITEDSAVAYNSGPGATLTKTSAGYRLEMSSLGINVELEPPEDIAIIPSGTLQFTAAATNYSMLGVWTLEQSATSGVISTFITGYRTADADVPTTGTAVYAGTDNVAGITIYTNGDVPDVAALLGDAEFTANFATGAITGEFSNMTATPQSGSSATPWNNVSITGSFATQTGYHGSLGGLLTTTSTNGAAATMPTGAYGPLSGFLAGPDADELVGLWSLYSPGHSAFGFVGAERTP